MPKNPNLLVSQTSFLPQVMHGTMNARTTQDFYNTRALTFVLKKKTKKLQERTFLGETSILLLIKKKTFLIHFSHYYYSFP